MKKINTQILDLKENFAAKNYSITFSYVNLKYYSYIGINSQIVLLTIKSRLSRCCLRLSNFKIFKY